MEKITLKPISREINYKATEPNTYFDAYEYSPRDDKEKHLGNLYVVGQVKYGEENMAYVLNLVSSLAKREYYSENGAVAEDPKKALDLALKKLNGVLDDFFQNKELKLNIGLVAVAGENIYIAKLGKFKVLLARNGEMIDILNNINLFQKEHVEEKKFANIISGKIFDGDKIFALYPTRQTTVKEKLIKLALTKHNQEDFLAEVATYGEKSKTFQCCGFHITVKKFKEEDILIKSAYEKSKIILASVPVDEPVSPPATSNPNLQREPEAAPVPAPKEHHDIPDQEEEVVLPKQAKIISAEMAVIKRRSFFSKITDLFSRKPALRAKSIAPAVIVLAMLAGGFYLAKTFLFNGEGEQSTSLQSAEENIRLAEIQMTKNENNSARELLGLSLASLSDIKETSRKVSEIRSRIATILDRLDLVSPRQPELWFDAATTDFSRAFAPSADTLIVVGTGNSVAKISGGTATPIATLPAMEAKYAFAGQNYFSLFNGNDQVAAAQMETGKVSAHQLAEATPVQDAAAYEGNLYVLSGNSIYKYTDGTISGSSARQTWFSGLADQEARAITIDGNVYVLTGNGTIIKYFRNKEESRTNLNIKVGENVEFFTAKDSSTFYVADYDDRKIRVFDKTSGDLLVTYKFADLLVIKNFAFFDHTAFIISGDNKIWKMDLTQ
ncbi:MAG: hypothetical protein Q7S32_01315 [bacterium]|nr:hypothetical protein [bacterium]